MEIKRLRLALEDETGTQLDYYLEDNKSLDIISDIKKLIREAQVSTSAGELKANILKVLQETK